jgi:acyl-CoA reductase-like NAD-dependent aldehyde dehydrogenase
VGKPISEARGEVARTVAILRYYAQVALDPIGETYPSPDGRASLSVERRPLGTVALVCPWNFPLAIPAWKLAPALAVGNTVLLKPSSAALATATRLVELGQPHLPSGVLSVVSARGELADRLLDDPRVAGISFTGSAEVGHAIVARAVSRGAAVQAEMGGQNASVVLEDADLDAAAAMIAGAAMGYAGQKCTATSRVVVLRGVAERFVPLLVDRVRGLAVGDPLDEGTTVGPLISRDARDQVRSAVEDAVGRGARVLAGRSEPDRAGWFYAPTLLAVADAGDPFTQEETFGPAASVLVADSDADAVRIANGTRYGLSAAVFSQNLHHATTVAGQLDAGLIRVNASTAGVDYYAPFGGERASSYGPREQGRAALQFYTRTRTILVNPPA